jgi:hypothetical protein
VKVYIFSSQFFYIKDLVYSLSKVHLNNVIVGMYVNCFDKHEEPQKTETKERECGGIGGFFLHAQ